MTDDNKPADQPAPLSERDKMLGDYYARQLRKRVELARVRSPAGLGRLFPGLGTKRKK